MTYPRFRELWHALITHRAMPPGPKREPDLPASPHLMAELAKAGQQQPSEFDQIPRLND